MKRVAISAALRQAIRWLPVLCSLLVIVSPVHGSGIGSKAPWYRVGSWLQPQGLPQNTIHVIVQTRDGYLWLGTNAGLSRFDGVNFTTFDNRDRNKLRDNEVRRLVEGDDGSLWIATFGGGLSRYRDGKFTVYTTENGLVHNFVDALAKDSEGAIWAGTERGISRFKDEHFTNFTEKDGPVLGVTGICLDNEGRLWMFKKSGGMLIYKDGVFTQQTIEGLASTAHINSICSDRQGNLWIATGDGLFQVQGDRTRHFTTKDGLSSNALSVILVDREGSLFITTDHGIDQYIPETSIFRSILKADEIGTIYQDREGSLWIGYTLAGLGRILPGVFTSYMVKDGLLRPYVTTTVEDGEGSVWVGTSGGLNYIKAGHVQALGEGNGLPRNFVSGLCEDQTGHLWVGNSAGLYRSVGSIETGTTNEDLQFVQIKNPELPATEYFRSIFAASDGTIWISLDKEGLVRIRGEKFVRYTRKDGLSVDFIRSLAEDRDGSLWIGTRGGGLIHFKDEKFTCLSQKDGLVSDSVVALYMDSGNVLWIGTRQGLHRLKEGRLSTFTVENGLFSNFILSISEDNKGDLWMTCRNGVFQVNKHQLEDFADGKARSFQSTAYGIEHGLCSTIGNSGHQPETIKAKDGRMWFALDGGVSVVDPALIMVNALPPPVHIEEISIDHRLFNSAMEAKAVPGRGDLVIQYTGLSFLAPEKVQFKYKLDGFDNDWVNAGGRRTAYYNNLVPGHYQFHVIAANNDGVWNDTGASVSIYLVPHFYQTAWFRTIVAGGMVLLIFGGIKYRTRSLRLREKELESLVGKRTSELQQQQEKVQQQRSFLRKVIDLNPCFIFAKDQLGRFTLANQAVADAYGTTVDGLFGKTDRDLSPKIQGTEPGYSGDLQLLNADIKEDTSEQLITDRNGKKRWMQITKIPLDSPESKDQQVLGVAMDVTLPKEAAIHMQEAKEAAEAATRAKSAFLANMSHEIRTPMNAVVGMTSLLLHTPLTPKQKEYVDTILTGGDSLLTVVNDILDFSKIESGKLDLEEMPFDLRSCVEQALDMVAGRAFDKKLELVYAMDREVPETIIGDVTRLRQILVNLLGNAVKFTQKGEVMVKVAVRQLSAGRHELHFAVRDTGIGIPADKVGVLFQSFSQVDASTTKLYGGTGLGLAISKRLCELMNGRIWLESEEGKGSVFQFTIQANAPKGAVRRGFAKQWPVLAGKRVLIVDDNAGCRSIISGDLGEAGMLTTVATTCFEAGKMLADHLVVDIAILDGCISEPGGGLVAQLRQMADSQQFPVVMLSSNNSLQQAAGQLEEKDSYIRALPKPVKPRLLMALLANLLSGRNDSIVSIVRTPHPFFAASEYTSFSVLLAEDNIVNQKVALRMLEQLGYKADIAKNGIEALAALGRKKYDVVLMDLQMPEMDGLEATRQICALLPEASRPWIIAMTANAMEGDRQTCLQAGMNDYLSKPVKIAALKNAFARVGTVGS